MSSVAALCTAALLGLLLMALAGCGHVPIASVSATVLPADLLPTVAGQMGCGAIHRVAVPLVKIKETRYDFNGDGVPDAVLAVRCDTGAGNPPSAVFALAATPAGPIVEQLLDPAAGEVVRRLRTAGEELSVVSYGYSADAPRCCPDVELTRVFHWDGRHFAAGPTTRRPI